MFQLPSGGAGLSPLERVTSELRRNDWALAFAATCFQLKVVLTEMHKYYPDDECFGSIKKLKDSLVQNIAVITLR